jgi:hypothetical protein
MPGCSRSPLCLNMYITPAQLIAATMLNGRLAGGIARGFAAADVRGGSGCGRGENGSAGAEAECEYRRGMKERIVRPSTYSTICSFI